MRQRKILNSSLKRKYKQRIKIYQRKLDNFRNDMNNMKLRNGQFSYPTPYSKI